MEYFDCKIKFSYEAEEQYFRKKPIHDAKRTFNNQITNISLTNEVFLEECICKMRNHISPNYVRSEIKKI